ncbi:glutathione S-transferase [Humitalea rosea]|uniref:Glutathione S-transferase n=1 Tax=Humitalea rosea TaxID=990373 RepID=A0A2W7IQR8_9PROT|nr:glutathione S-transferase N-terminal domain-containing protein [Humitalea rosea]PZW48643.1 glutathione S-transferase [Humitalea rosea]
MKLFWSSRSPFARKVMVAAHELGIADQIAQERVVVSVAAPNDTVLHHNPLGQIPTLVLDDGTVFFDSAVILEVLDQRHGPLLFPTDPAARFPVLRLQAIGDGLMENSVRRLGESTRGVLVSAPHVAAAVQKMSRTLDWLEAEAASLASLNAGSIAIACGLGHLDFRFGAEDWRPGRPALAAWHAGFAERASMRATAHRDEY